MNILLGRGAASPQPPPKNWALAARRIRSGSLATVIPHFACFEPGHVQNRPLGRTMHVCTHVHTSHPVGLEVLLDDVPVPLSRH